MESVAREIGVGVSTLERWRSDALSRPARERAWTAAARFEAVLTTAPLDEAGKSAWCREHGVYPQELAQWRQAATQALAEPEERGASPQQTKQDRRRKGRRSAKVEETPAADIAAPAAEPVFEAPPAEAPAAAPKKARSSRKKADKKPEAAEAPVVAAEAPADAAPKKPRSRRTKKTEG